MIESVDQIDALPADDAETGRRAAPGPPRQRAQIDRQHPKVYRAQLEPARSVKAAVADAELPRTLVELVNIRVSQINGCAYCLHVHVRDALHDGETTQRLAVLPAWRDTKLFTDRERAAAYRQLSAQPGSQAGLSQAPAKPADDEGTRSGTLVEART